MTRTLFFHMVLRKISEITSNKLIFSQYNTFYNCEYFFLQSAFWPLLNHGKKSQSNQEQCSLCCSSSCFIILLCTHYGQLPCFSTDFRTLKEAGVLRLMCFHTMLFLLTMLYTKFPILSLSVFSFLSFNFLRC